MLTITELPVDTTGTPFTVAVEVKRLVVVLNRPPWAVYVVVTVAVVGVPFNVAVVVNVLDTVVTEYNVVVEVVNPVDVVSRPSIPVKVVVNGFVCVEKALLVVLLCSRSTKCS